MKDSKVVNLEMPGSNKVSDMDNNCTSGWLRSSRRGNVKMIPSRSIHGGGVCIP